MSKKYIHVEYQTGIFKNITIEDWLNSLETRFPGYELFQIDTGSYWTPAGTEYWREAYLKLID